MLRKVHNITLFSISNDEKSLFEYKNAYKAVSLPTLYALAPSINDKTTSEVIKKNLFRQSVISTIYPFIFPLLTLNEINTRNENAIIYIDILYFLPSQILLFINHGFKIVRLFFTPMYSTNL